VPALSDDATSRGSGSLLAERTPIRGAATAVPLQRADTPPLGGLADNDGLHGLCSQESRLAVARWLRSPAQDPQLWAWACTCRRPPAGRQPGVQRLGKHRPPARCGQPRRLPGGTTLPQWVTTATFPARPSCRASRPSTRTGFRSARFDKHRPSPPRAVAEGIGAAKNQEHGRGTVARAPPRWSAAGQDPPQILMVL